MVEIGKVTPKFQEKDFRMRTMEGDSAAERMQLVEALRHGNIYEVFAKQNKFKIGDFADFFSQQWKTLRGQVIQDTEIKAMEGSFHEPDINQFALHHRGASLSDDERQFFGKSMMEFIVKATEAGSLQPKSGKLQKGQEAGATGDQGSSGGHLLSGSMPKGQAVEGTSDTSAAQTSTGDGTSSGTGDGTTEAKDPASMAQETLGEWDQFKEDMWGQIFDAQMSQDYQKRMGEINAEVQKILSMVKSGAIEPEYALIALAKVNSTKNGCLMTWLGKKAFHINESLCKISDELKNTSPSSSSYYGLLQESQSKTRDGSFQLNLLVQDMQKVMGDVAGTLEFVKSFLSEVGRHRREIATKFAVH